MTKDKFIQMNYKLDVKGGFIMDRKEFVKDYEILQVDSHDCCSYWKLKEFKDVYGSLQIVNIDTKEVLSNTTDFSQIGNTLLEKEVISYCVDSLNNTLILYVKMETVQPQIEGTRRLTNPQARKEIDKLVKGIEINSEDERDNDTLLINTSLEFDAEETDVYINVWINGQLETITVVYGQSFNYAEREMNKLYKYLKKYYGEYME